MLGISLGLLALAGFFACRWRDADTRVGLPGSSDWTRWAGRALRVALMPAIVGIAFADWRPTIVRHASSEWLVRKARDENSRFRYAAVDELVQRLNGGRCDAVELAGIVRGLWTIQASPDETFTVGTPFAFNLALLAPAMPMGSDTSLSQSRSLGAIEWHVVSASFGGTPIGMCANASAQSTPVQPGTRAGFQTMPLPQREARSGLGTFRCEVAFAYRSPGGAIVGPTWSESFARPIYADSQP